MARPKMSEGDDLVGLALKIPASYKQWIKMEAARQTLKSEKTVNESDIIRELIARAKKQAERKASNEATK